MPYITKERRAAVDEWGPSEPGDLAYILAKQIDSYLATRGISYSEYASTIGVLETLKLEIVQRFLGPYEAVKLEENGEVFYGVTKTG